MPFSQPLRGIIPPLVTPIHEDFTLDHTSLIKIIEHTIAGGVHGIFILGTTGEFASLSSIVKHELISMTCAKVDGLIPVLVGITDCSFNESLNLAAKALDSGASAVVATSPFYMNIGQEELVNYYQKLADKVELPLLLYNMPSHTGMAIDLSSVAILAEHPNIIGIKANLFPELYVKLYEAILAKNYELVEALQVTVLFLSKNLYSYGTYKSNYLKGLKASMSFSGLCKDVLALPLFPYSEEEKAILKHKYDAVLARVNSVL